MISIAATTLSKLSSGSPIPIRTTLVTARSPFGPAPRARRASHSWEMISASVRLRLKPWRPVAQKLQFSAQPTWVETHNVPRPSSGMKTVSTAVPSSSCSSHLRVPSAASWSWVTAGGRMTAVSFRRARSSLLKLVMASKSSRPNWWIHCSICAARYGFSPMPAKKSSSPRRPRSSRLVFSPVFMVGSARARTDPAVAEKIIDLELRGLLAVRAVHRVFLHVRGEVGADRAGRGLFRIGRAHELAVSGNRAFALEHLHQHRSRGHERNEIVVQRPLLVHGVKAQRLLPGELQHLRRDDAQPGALEAADDLADLVLGDGVGLDD